MKIIYIIIIALSLIWVSCQKPVKYSEIPDIKFLSIPIKDTIIFENHIKRCVLSYYLIDGDGDIGFKDGDTLPPYEITGNYHNNVLITMYKMVNGIYNVVDTPEIGTYLYFRTKYIESIDQNKALKCTILIYLDFFTPMSWDSVRFDFYMYDRALNKSNLATTGLIVFN
ncbi:MAG: hypothetical protein A2X08_04585 [Bacteroidetes bacterium GWA2_32_17]|nr:MAG: hypothetical protein A2X08_04585 [Bacteroidetes bacterium GWA2_32_17]